MSNYSAFSPIDYGPVLVVKVVEDHTGSFPTGFASVYKCLVCTLTPPTDPVTEHSGGVVVVPPGNTDRYVFGLNFRPNKIRMNSVMLAFKVQDYYVLDNQSTFQENS